MTEMQPKSLFNEKGHSKEEESEEGEDQEGDASQTSRSDTFVLTASGSIPSFQMPPPFKPPPPQTPRNIEEGDLGSSNAGDPPSTGRGLSRTPLTAFEIFDLMTAKDRESGTSRRSSRQKEKNINKNTRRTTSADPRARQSSSPKV